MNNKDKSKLGLYINTLQLLIKNLKAANEQEPSEAALILLAKGITATIEKDTVKAAFVDFCFFNYSISI